MKKTDLVSMIREAVKIALEARGYDGMEEPKELRKARLAGSAQARQKFAQASPEELQAAYLKIEAQAEREMDDLKNTFLWGACDAIKKMLKQQGIGQLPRKSQDPWAR